MKIDVPFELGQIVWVVLPPCFCSTCDTPHGGCRVPHDGEPITRISIDEENNGIQVETASWKVLVDDVFLNRSLAIAEAERRTEKEGESC